MPVNKHNIYTRPALQGTTYLADQRLTVDDTSGGVTFTDYTASYVDTVELDVQDADVMVTFDDSAPTTSNGHRLQVGTKCTWSVARFNVAKFIRATSTNGTVHASPSMI